MKIIDQSYQILSLPDNTLEMIERAARTCYKSENKITQESAPKFVKMLINRGHYAMIEFGDITVKFTTNRGVTHELVRHRMCSFAQESTRYVRYDGGMEFIRPVWCPEQILGEYVCTGDINPDLNLIPSDEVYIFIKSLIDTERAYRRLLFSWRPEQAREVMPNSLKTDIVVKANIREWRHILTIRTSKSAHPQMRGLLLPLLKELKAKVPGLFDDIISNDGPHDGKPCLGPCCPYCDEDEAM